VNFSDVLGKGLSLLDRNHQKRSLRFIQSMPGPRMLLQDRTLVNFASNNYLDLAGDERVILAGQKALGRWGAGATGSRLMGGTLGIHRELENELASLKETEASLVFPSGYHANLGMISALVNPDDVVVLDRLAHASLVDGARLSKASLRVFRHNDANHLAHVLKKLTGFQTMWVITESVFSMDGDRAPLLDLLQVCEKFGARFYVDEAHATGVWGGGRGCVNALGLSARVDVCMGTLSKALGTQGGFVAGSKSLIEWGINRARAFIYSTALSPSSTGAALEALKISREEPWRRERLFWLSQRLRQGLGVVGEGPIVPVLVGGDEDVLALGDRLRDAGFLAPAVRPPTVPRGTARLRISLTAGHSEEEVDGLVNAIKGCSL